MRISKPPAHSMIKQSGDLSSILASDLGIDPKYRHTSKRVTAFVPAWLESQSVSLAEDLVDLGEWNGLGERVEGSSRCNASRGADEGAPCDARQGRAD